MRRFEYKIMDLLGPELQSFSKREAVLNQLGRQGWELIAVYERFLYFKREL